jgi:3-oxoacyl-[acyl-carrier-protein] synthase-3
MAEASHMALLDAGLTAADVDLMVPHQANIRIIDATAKYTGIPMDKVFVNLDRYGNMSSASIPVALDEALEEGRIGPGSNVLSTAFGAGLTWGAQVWRF